MSDFTPDNISYTNKDFQSIYNELLELVPKLTNKWDPSLSNESDPLVVLLKLNALLADKNNYNIDKNVLELFPSSVTQRGNAQKIYESLGYNLRWYQSSIAVVYLKWNGDTITEPVDLITDSNDPFLQITDDTGEIVYTIIPTAASSLENASDTLRLPIDNNSISAYALEGTLHTYEINGGTTITLQNLDSNLRLYFTESQVAENGIFIKNVGSGYNWATWERVDNLEATQLGKYVYKFGVLPNTNTCYIEFPQDIANLIDQGLTIKYVISSGAQGIVASNTLNSLYTDLKIETISYKADDGTTTTESDVVVNDYVKIWNPSASMGGSDPEDIDDAYLSFQKVVNTFNTLVTCKDYENVIYRLEDDSTSLPIIGNCVVSDRTNDIVSTTKIKSLTLNGVETVLQTPSTTSNDYMSAFNLKFYLLNYRSLILNSTQYENTFNSEVSLEPLVENELEDYKSIQHDIINPLVLYKSTDDVPYIFKNKYDIDCKLTTYNKVSDTEIKSIKENVTLALYKNFDSRNVDFGSAVSYDNLLEVIQNADSRIKNVILNDPTYTTYYLDTRSGEDKALSDTDLETTVKAKNILAGVSQGITFNNDFNYELDQSKGTVYPNTISEITDITTHTSVNISAGSTYKLKDNESVTFYAPSLIADTTYSYYLYYKIEGASSADDFFSKYVDGDYFVTAYTINLYSTRSLSGSIYSYSNLKATIEAGTVISLSGFRTSSSTTLDLEGSLGSDKTITTYNQNSQTVSKIDGYIKCYWILNNKNNNLYTKLKYNNNNNTWSMFLDNGEYFLYTDSSESNLYVLGAGTSIVFNCAVIQMLTSAGEFSSTLEASTIENIESINESNISDISWIDLLLTNTDGGTENTSVVVTENQLVTLGYGSSITSSKAINLKEVNNGTEAAAVEGTITYTTTENTTGIPLPASPEGWKAFSALNLLGYKDYPMNLYEGQSLILNDSNSDNSHTVVGGGNIKVQFSEALSLPGGTEVPVGIYDDSLNIQYPLKVYAYTQDSNVARSGDYVTVIFSEEGSAKYNLPEGKFIIPIIWSSTAGSTLDVTVTNGSISLYGVSDSASSSISGLEGKDNAYYLKVNSTSSTDEGIASITFESSGAGDLNIGKLYYIDKDIEKGLLGKIQSLDSDNLFDYTHQVDEDINIEDPTSPDSFFNSYHVMNRFTIPQINNINLTVVSSSKL